MLLVAWQYNPNDLLTIFCRVLHFEPRFNLVISVYEWEKRALSFVKPLFYFVGHNNIPEHFNFRIRLLIICGSIPMHVHGGILI